MPDPRQRAFILALAAAPSLATAQGIQLIESPISQAALKEAVKLGFDPSTQERFWSAWRQDVTSASHPEWHALVLSCARSEDPCLRLWGLARLVEAGDPGAVEPYGKLMAAQLDAFRTGDPDWRRSLLAGPESLPGASWEIRRDSPFWKTFWASLDRATDLEALRRSYAIWSWNGAPEDRDALLGVMSRLGADSSPGSDAWGDPRFRMVMDWLCEFGERADWDRITAMLPKGSGAFLEASRLYEDLKESPDFWGPACPDKGANALSGPRPVLRSSGRLFREAPAKKLETRGRFGFEICIGHDGRPSRCRPTPAPWAAEAATTGVRYISSWVFNYPGVERARWPEATRMHLEILLK